MNQYELGLKGHENRRTQVKKRPKKDELRKKKFDQEYKRCVFGGVFAFMSYCYMFFLTLIDQKLSFMLFHFQFYVDCVTQGEED